MRGGGRDFTAPCHVSLEMTRRFDCEFSFFPIKYPRVRYHGPLSEEEDESFQRKEKLIVLDMGCFVTLFF